MRIPMGKGAGLGCGGLLLVVVIALLTGTDPMQLLDAVGSGPSAGVSQGPAGTTGTPGDERGEFAAAVLGLTEETWGEVFAGRGADYREPTLVLFDRATPSACGFGSAAVGPFYCPADERIYLDLTFFDELDRRFGAEGDFAEAYVIAHEVGHHVQNLLGISDQVRGEQRRLGEADANELSVRLELQADCLAGVWGASHRDLLEPGDVEEGLAAAAAIGDDTLQRTGGGEVQPESWTHGSSAQRVRWLRRGLESGDPDRCDTFSAAPF
jgi:uncharacterized protein